ncbi:hypothetical protein [Mesorhizobium sp. CN2-181]|uniref:hypothetical protein n=1 Tax=Mesorhizobium yinganensis TaxID=3157707 RepID=UPI0032B7DC2B
MLLRLAVLAELLCVQPFFLRVLLLPLMRHAEAVAREFAIRRVGGVLAMPPAKVHAPDFDGCLEALRLARCLRALAAFFGCWQGLAGRLFRGGPDERHARRAPAIGWACLVTSQHAIALHAAGRMDTS